MTNSTTSQPHNFLAKRAARRVGGLLSGIGVVLFSLMPPALAGDPFRPDNPRDISDTSEQIFYAMFRDGNYVQAREYVENADASASRDPLFHALSAALAYMEEDWPTLETNAELTKRTAAQLSGTDPLRSNLYEAVGIFLEGAHVLQTDGIAQGTPRALVMLQRVFDLMETAEEIDPQDPELNLLKGYMDLLLSVNLPFADPERAIAQLANYGHPSYVSYRGIALGYRDLDRDAEALAAVDVALAAAPENPDLLYLKAQILRRLGRDEESIGLFREALQYDDQLPADTNRQIAFEQCKAEGQSRDVCNERADAQYGS